MRVSQVLGILFSLAGLWAIRRVRRFPRRRLATLGRLAAALACVTLGGWLAYVGWHFAPKRMGEIAEAEASLAEIVPDRPIFR